MISEFIGYILQRRLAEPCNKQVSGVIMTGYQPAWIDAGHYCFISYSTVLCADLSLWQKNFFIPFIMFHYLNVDKPYWESL